MGSNLDLQTIDEVSPHSQRFQVLPLASITLGWCLFVLSAFNYKNTNWFMFLLGSRVVLVLIGSLLIAGVLKGRLRSHNLATGYLFVSLLTQSMHGILEGADRHEFYNFTGVIFLLVALAYRGTYRTWLTQVLPICLAVVSVPLFFKSSTLLFPLGVFIDHFSQVIAGVVLGIAVGKINSERHSALMSLVQTKERLVEEKQKALQRKEETQKIIEAEVERLRSRIENESTLKALGVIAAQVSHDIRSPLASLNAIIHSAEDFDEDTRIQVRTAVRRIKDIANGLLSRSREAKASILSLSSEQAGEALTSCVEPKSVELLITAIESAVSQKRLQYVDRKDVELTFHADRSTFVLFAVVQPVELQRIFSNILNNSFEAVECSGRISINLQRQGNYASISFSDNGKGISGDLIDKVLERGGTYGKPGGNGLGLSHAKIFIESWGGKLMLESTIGKGTRVSILLPIAESPKWLVEKLKVNPETTCVIADGDPSVHDLWRRSLKGKMQETKLIHLTSPEEVLMWYREHLHLDDVLYLCDYEFSNSRQNGIDLIEMTGTAGQAILVTSHWDDADVRSRCERLSLRIFPKSFIPNVELRG